MDDTAKPNDRHVAIVIVNYRTPDLALECLDALKPERRLLPRLNVILVDGGSGDGSAEKLARATSGPDYEGWVSFLPLSLNGGFGWANNQAILMLLRGQSSPDFIHLLNPDSKIEHGAVAALVRYLVDHPKVAVVGSQLLEPDGLPSGSAFKFPTVRGELGRGARTRIVDWILRVPALTLDSIEAREVDWVTGASFMIRTEALKQVGLFDDGFFLYHEEVELMWRIRSGGWTVAFEPKSRVEHVGGASTGVNNRMGLGVRPRRPAYWYRSRARLFALTRGTEMAVLAYLLWFVGHAVWALRRITGLAPGAEPWAHQFRDHARFGLPRPNDAVGAVREWNDDAGRPPAWMQRGTM